MHFNDRIRTSVFTLPLQPRIVRRPKHVSPASDCQIHIRLACPAGVLGVNKLTANTGPTSHVWRFFCPIQTLYSTAQDITYAFVFEGKAVAAFRNLGLQRIRLSLQE